MVGYNTDKIMTRPAPDESIPLEGPRWSDSLPILVQAKLIETFENAGYTNDVTRTLGDFPNSDQLSIDIRRFDISTYGDPTATIVILAKIQSSDGSVLASKKFETTVPAEGTEPRDYVGALRSAFEQTATSVLRWTTETLSDKPAIPLDGAGGSDLPSTDIPDEFSDLPPQ